jgi:hypothetical protein
MNIFTENEVQSFETKVLKEKFFKKFIWYNSYLSISYIIPITNFKGFKVPQWSKISSVELLEDNYIINVSLFKDNNFLYDIETALKYDLITFY